MPHVIEPAPTGRAKCRGCAEKIGAGELRFGESLPNPFAEGEAFQWSHLECGAMKRPESFLEAIGAASDAPPDKERLEALARQGVEHPRVARVSGAEHDPSGRAHHPVWHVRQALPPPRPVRRHRRRRCPLRRSHRACGCSSVSARPRRKRPWPGTPTPGASSASASARVHHEESRRHHLQRLADAEQERGGAPGPRARALVSAECLGGSRPGGEVV